MFTAVGLSWGLVAKGNQLLCYRLLISIQRLCCRWLVPAPSVLSIKKLGEWFMVIPYDNISSLKIIVPFGDCVVYSKCFLLCGAPFSLCVQECLRKKNYWEFCSIMFLGQLCSTGIIGCMGVHYVSFVGIWVL